MLWSSFRKTDGKYAIGQAVSASGDVLGPWVQEPETLNSDDGGHAMVFKDLKGRLMISYHAPNSQTEHPVITPIYIKDGKFVGSAKGTDIGYTWNRLSHYRGSFSGQFDENGYMDGDWTFKEDDDSIYVFHATYEHGVCRKCYREDITTGDIAEGAIKIDLHSIIIDN